MRQTPPPCVAQDARDCVIETYARPATVIVKAGHALCLLAAIVASSGGRAAQPIPQRVMSISLCTDQLVLALLPPGRISSVTWLGRSTGSARTLRAALHVGINHQTAEEVVRQRPDLVVAGSFSAPATIALLKRLNVPVIEVPSAKDFAAIRSSTRLLGHALGVPARADALVAAMDQALAQAAASPVPGSSRVAAWDGSGNVPGPGTLYDAVVTAAGARNVGREPGRRAGAFHAEALLAAAPDVLLHDAPRGGGGGGRSDELVGHRIVRRFWANRQIVVPQDEFVCGTPYTGEAVLALNAALRRFAGRHLPPLRFARAEP